jgi:hypothetical protein
MLNAWRGSRRGLKSLRSFLRLGRVLWWLLDACRRFEDVAAAKIVMIMAQTFYWTPDGGGAAGGAAGSAAGGGAVAEDDEPKRRYVQELIASHPLWQQLGFWESAFYHSLREEVAKLYNPNARAAVRPATGGASTAAWAAAARDGDDEAEPGSSGAAAASPPPTPAEADDGIVEIPASVVVPGSAQWRHVYRNAIFGQLASYTMNMREFGVPERDVVRVVTRLAHGNGLPMEMLQTLLREARASDMVAPSAAPSSSQIAAAAVASTGVAAAAAAAAAVESPDRARRQRRRDALSKRRADDGGGAAPALGAAPDAAAVAADGDAPDTPLPGNTGNTDIPQDD